MSDFIEGYDRRGVGLALIGYRGTGKSTVGRMVARRAGLEFVDSDKEIEVRAGKSIASIFAQDGEPAFRDLEAEVVADLCVRDDIILATGGGAILRVESRSWLRRFGLVIWLAAPAATLASRLGRDAGQTQGRPALTAAGTLNEIADVLESRFPLYAQTSDLTVDTEGRSAARVAEVVFQTWTAWRESGGQLKEVGNP